MGILLTLPQVLKDAEAHKGHILIRKQNCIGCSNVLAVEITDKLGSRGEYWVAKDAIRYPSGTDLFYNKEVWFGNHVKCLICGLEGKLPMDKPLSAENIGLSREVKNGKKN
jgi:hypothetical protein